MGNIYYANKEYKKAVEIYTRLLKEYPSNPYILKNFLTIISQYDPDLALSEMLKLYDIHKNYAPLLANLGLIYMKKEDYVKGKEYMTTAISLDENNIFYTYNLAVILDKLSDFKNATIFYLKLLNMATTSKDVSEKNTFIQSDSKTKIYKTPQHAPKDFIKAYSLPKSNLSLFLFTIIILSYRITSKGAISSAGRASRLHRGGRQFKSVIAHLLN